MFSLLHGQLDDEWDEREGSGIADGAACAAPMVAALSRYRGTGDGIVRWQ
jgi:hypothetical protein